MCGFAGEFLFNHNHADVELARRMARRLIHRGPDAEGHFLSSDKRCAIGFRRLAVIDPAGSHQPMTLPDGSLVVAFNGEIYNFRRLRDELCAEGAVFRTAGDTEVLLHLYARHNTDMLHHLEGMFAFVLYDVAAGRLMLARDRLGQKPLWYAVLDDRIVFASEAKALLEHPGVPKAIDGTSIIYYASMGYVPCPRGAFASVRKLQPGCLLLASTQAEAARQYWAPSPDSADRSAHEQIKLLRERLDRAVAERMVADVPLGALLSGGVDSAVVVALMSRHAGRAGGVRTFTAGFDDQEFDERADARRVAEHCGTDHRELVVRVEPAGVLDRIVEMYDEPFADSSALPTWAICHAAREHVTVALTGDGGDEAFAGYDRYRAMYLADALGPGQYALLRAACLPIRLVAPHHERSRLRRFLRFMDACLRPPASRYFAYRRLFGPEGLSRLLTAEFLEGMDVHGPEEWFCQLYEQFDTDSEVTRAQLHDLSTYLPDDLLVKADIASMASSLELRSPMVSAGVVRLGLSLPTEMKLGRRRGKRVLRAAFGDMLPPQVFRRSKRGFGVPLARWLREDMLEEMQQTLLDKGFLERGIVRPEAVVGLINDHVARRADHGHRLWALLVLARWLGRYA